MRTSGLFLVCSLLLVTVVSLAESKRSVAPTATPFPFSPLSNPTAAEKAEEDFRVSFNITSCNQDSKLLVNRGFFVLHSFWYWKANDYFTNATNADPNCVMGYWGQAMQLWHPLWAGMAPINYVKARSLIQRAREVDHDLASEMEWKNVESIEEFFGSGENDTRTIAEREEAYSTFMESLYRESANNDSKVDVDTSAFYALSLVAIATRQDDGTLSGKYISENTRRLAVSVIESAKLIDDEHPGLIHYNIHAYDTNTLAPLALEAADTYASVAPNVPHALHMPSHIYIRLGMWNESIDSNIKSMDSALYWISIRDPEAIYDSDYVHAINFLSYSYLQQGNPSQSKFYIDDLESVVSSGNFGSSDQERIVIANWLMEMKCSYLLETERYDEAAVIERLPSTPSCDSPACYYTQLQIVYTRVVGNSIIRDFDSIQRELDELQKLASEVQSKKMSDEMKNFAQYALKTAQAWQMYSTHNISEAINTMQSVIDYYNLDDAHSIPLIESREVLGYFLLGDFDYESAYNSYTDSLDIEGQGRLIAIYGAARSADLRGKEDDAAYYYSMFLNQCHLCVAYLNEPGANTTLSYNYKEKSKTATKYLFDYRNKSDSDVDLPVGSLVLIVLVTAAITALLTVYICKRVRVWRDSESYKRQHDEHVHEGSV